MNSVKTENVEALVEATIQEKKWTDFQLLSFDLTTLLHLLGHDQLPAPVKIEDQAYIDNALAEMRLCKAYDYLCLFEQAHNKARRAAKIIDKLVLLRRSQAKGEQPAPESVDPLHLEKVSYDVLTAPFLFKLGDTLASYIETNTDELNNMKPFEYEDSSESESDDDGSAEVEAPATEHDPREETKEGEQIDTSSAPRVEEVPRDEGKLEAEKPQEDLEQDAQDYLSLALQLVRDFSQSEGVLEGEKAARRKIFLFLEIDSLLRRAELGKKVSAY